MTQRSNKTNHQVTATLTHPGSPIYAVRLPAPLRATSVEVKFRACRERNHSHQVIINGRLTSSRLTAGRYATAKAAVFYALKHISPAGRLQPVLAAARNWVNLEAHEKAGRMTAAF